MQTFKKCNVCEKPEVFGADTETAQVRSNIRKFRDETFAVWRCRGCRSIHARDPVDLDHYYACYPFHKQKLDWMLRRVYSNLLRRLTRAGLKKSHKILDHGCGSGHLVNFIRSKGYENVVGYDAYSAQNNDPSLLEHRYNCIISQDVLEHVDEPRQLLKQYSEMASAGAIIAIGTPNADAIDLAHAETHVHTLHQPYHIHMLSKPALIGLGQAMGWHLQRLYLMSYVNTLIPFININFGLHYARFFDNTLDLAFEDFKLSHQLLYPRTLFLAFLGYFKCPQNDIMAIFRTPCG
jgi:2-polyprenyl-3-methyl-5-hydroxy-6-metoxy-1,4-benzoquinol methylase